MTIRVFAPAKVNLHLAVGDKRDDGYHDVTTVLHSLTFGDTVVIEPDSSFGFLCTPDLGLHPEDNLACRAAKAMADRFDRPLDVRVSVEKRIPAGAGLGGASADASGVIAGLASLWGIDGREGSLAEVARGLGADVPFLLLGGAALYTGRGDLLDRTLPALDAAVVVLKPVEPVLTVQAYAAFDRRPHRPSPGIEHMVAALEAGDAARVGKHLHNNLTEAALQLAPGIGSALRLLGESHGVLGLALAGSGSAVFGVCEDDLAARTVAETARRAGLWAAATRTGRHGCEVQRET